MQCFLLINLFIFYGFIVDFIRFICGLVAIINVFTLLVVIFSGTIVQIMN